METKTMYWYYFWELIFSAYISWQSLFDSHPVAIFRRYMPKNVLVYNTNSSSTTNVYLTTLLVALCLDFSQHKYFSHLIFDCLACVYHYHWYRWFHHVCWWYTDCIRQFRKTISSIYGATSGHQLIELSISLSKDSKYISWSNLNTDKATNTKL